MMNENNNIPCMKTIKELSQKYGLPYHTISQWCHVGKFPYVKAGSKFLINEDRFLDFLNYGEDAAG